MTPRRPRSVTCWPSVLSAWLAGIMAGLAAPPPNDRFAQAQPITQWDQVIATDNTEATSEGGEPRLRPRSDRSTVWFAWQAPQDGLLRLRVDTGAFIEPLIAVFTGNHVARLSRVKLDSAGLTSSYFFSFVAAAGTTYWLALDSIGGRGTLELCGDFTTLQVAGVTNGQSLIQFQPLALALDAGDAAVDGPIIGVAYLAQVVSDAGIYPVTLGSSVTPPFALSATNPLSGPVTILARATNSSGQARLSAPVHVEVQPANDDFTNAAAGSGYEFYMSGTADNASPERGEPLHAGARYSRWWSWTAPANGRVQVYHLFPHADFGLGIYSGNELSRLKRVRTRRHSTSLFFEAEAGTTYRFAVAGRKRNRGADFYLTASLFSVELLSPAEGSSFTDAEPVLLAVATTENLEALERVEYLRNNEVIAVATNPPFSVLWNSVPGSHCISARAVRRDGLETLRTPDVCTVIIPANDHFTNATAVTTNRALLTARFDFATTEPGEPPLTLTYNRTVWWSFTAPTNGTLILAPIAASRLTTFGICTGDAVSALTLVATTRVSIAYDPSGGKIQLPVRPGMTYRIIVGSAFDSSATFRLQFYAPPANDHFTNRFAITANPEMLRAQFIEATSEPNEPPISPAQTNTVWWTWTAPRGGAVSFSAAPAGVYWSNSLETLVPVSDYHVVAGETWQIRFANTSPWTEAAEVAFEFEPAADNDTFALRSPITETNAVLSCDSNLATLEPGEPGPPNGLQRSLWWTWTADDDGDVHLYPAEGLPVFAVYQGQSLTSLTRVAGALGDVWFRAVRGHVYQIAVQIDYGSEHQAWHFEYVRAPANDGFANATAVLPVPAELALALAGASSETGEPMLGANDQRSVWFRWTAAESQPVLIGCAGALVGVFTGERIDQLTPVGQHNNEDAVILDAVAGGSYWIKVAGPSDYSFGLARRTLIVKPFLAPSNDSFAAALWLTNNAGQITAENWGGTIQPGELTNRFSVRRTLWYRWRAPSSGWLTLHSTVGDGPVFRIFLGTNLGGLFDVMSSRGFLTLPMWSGEDFRWQVDRENGEGGAISFSHLFEPAPFNDEFEQAASVTGPSAILEGDLRTATTEGQPYDTFSRFADRDIWWRWTAPATGPVLLTNLASGRPNSVRVFRGATRSNRVLVATNGPGTTPWLEFPATAGTTYSIVAGLGDSNNTVQWQLVLAGAGATADGSPGQAGGSFVVEFSTNLLEWIPIHTNTVRQDLRLFLRTTVNEAPAGFYRERVKN